MVPRTLISIRRLKLFQFKNYRSAFFDFEPSMVCITGSNGVGKTNLLDAVYYLCYTKSYFSPFQHSNVLRGTDGFRLEGDFERDHAHETVACRWREGKKEVWAQGIPYEKPTEHIGRYASVFIAPDDTQLINGSGEGRRRWIDGILSQARKDYLEQLLIYQKVLTQRNAWLKIHAPQPPLKSPEFQYYNQTLTEIGSFIFQHRKKFFAEFSPIFSFFYKKLSGANEVSTLSYHSHLERRSFADLLEESLAADVRMQRTLRGIHKDEIRFALDAMELKVFGSQGQKKSFLFALKLAQFAYLQREMTQTPILLLDDIFEKLDHTRIEALLSIIRQPEFGQVILTDTHKERVRSAFGQGVVAQGIHLDKS